MELENVISFWNNQKTKSSESLHEHGRIIHARACARKPAHWLFANFDLYDPLYSGSDPIDGKATVYWWYLVHQTWLLVAYKQQTFDNGMNWSGLNQCLSDNVRSAVECCFTHDSTISKLYQTAVQKKPKDTSFAWPGLTYTIKIWSTPATLGDSHILSHLQLFNCSPLLQDHTIVTLLTI